jgi:hypothetical protein
MGLPGRALALTRGPTADASFTGGLVGVGNFGSDFGNSITLPAAERCLCRRGGVEARVVRTIPFVVQIDERALVEASARGPRVYRASSCV